MENMDKGLTVSKQELIVWLKIPQNTKSGRKTLPALNFWTLPATRHFRPWSFWTLLARSFWTSPAPKHVVLNVIMFIKFRSFPLNSKKFKVLIDHQSIIFLKKCLRAGLVLMCLRAGHVSGRDLSQGSRPEMSTRHCLGSSTCPLTSFFWLLSHVIYLKLTRPEFSAKWMLSILSYLPLTRKTEKNVYFSILQIFEW